MRTPGSMMLPGVLENNQWKIYVHYTRLGGTIKEFCTIWEDIQFINIALFFKIYL